MPGLPLWRQTLQSKFFELEETNQLCLPLFQHMDFLRCQMFGFDICFLDQSEKNLFYSIFILAFPGPCASLTHPDGKFLNQSWPKWARDHRPAVPPEPAFIANKSIPREAGESPGQLPAHCTWAIRWPSLLVQVHPTRLLPKFLGDLIPNSSQLDFDPMPPSNHWIVSLVLPVL